MNSRIPGLPAALLLMVSCLHAHTIYSVTVVPINAGLNVAAVNGHDLVTGNTPDPLQGGAQVAAIFDVNAGTTTKLTLPAGYGYASGAWINQSGNIAGYLPYTDTGAGSNDFFYYDAQTQQYTVFHTPGGLSPYITGMNDSGTIVGYTSEGSFEASVGGGVQTLTITPPGGSTNTFFAALAINNSGQIVGSWALPPHSGCGFEYPATATYCIFNPDTPGAADSSQFDAINNSGLAIGNYYPPSVFLAVTFDGTSLGDLGDLNSGSGNAFTTAGAGCGGFQSVFAGGINDAGDVVGCGAQNLNLADYFDLGYSGPMVYTGGTWEHFADGSYVIPGWQPVALWAIDNLGAIKGEAVGPGCIGCTVVFEPGAHVTAPEPSGGLLALCGVLSAFLFRRKAGARP